MDRVCTFAQLAERLRGGPPSRIAVVSAHDEQVVAAAHEMAEDAFAVPVLIGDAARIEQLRSALNVTTRCEIVPAPDDREAARIAVRMAGDGDVQILMKGVVPTSIFLKEVIARERQVSTDPLLSHVTAAESAVHGRLLFVTDAGINITPDFDARVRILRNAAQVARALGIARPVAAVLCAIEKVNPSMPDTVEAQKLRELSESGDGGPLSGITVMGPVSLDLAVSPEAALVKGYAHPDAGRADILMVREITAGNILVKALHLFCDIPRGGIVAGASVPIALTSRSDSASERRNSVLLAAYMARFGTGRSEADGGDG